MTSTGGLWFPVVVDRHLADDSLNLASVFNALFAVFVSSLAEAADEGLVFINGFFSAVECEDLDLS